ncbi:Uncharacterised protein [Amycolatopsis camponoti]|uniref:Uncharacterized protein n=1 Tax=Amycolatopsis camponoti TaxID=2606593 RepID=A0A6I8M1E2_9PSEU|nr:Uncharacterised protein [Amycolatopsis camponoti]
MTRGYGDARRGQVAAADRRRGELARGRRDQAARPARRVAHGVFGDRPGIGSG